MNIVSEIPITMSELKKDLTKIKKREEELNMRATKTEEYLKQFTVLDVKKAMALKKAIAKIDVPRLKDIHIVKIIDLMPQSVDDLKIILQGYTLTVNKDNLKKLIDVIKAA